MHLACIWIVCHLSAKNYQNRWKFDEVLTKTNLLSFFWDTVYKLEYYKVIDTVALQLDNRFKQEGLLVYKQLEKCLLLGEVTYACREYPEISQPALQTQLSMFRQQFKSGM